MHFSCRLYEGAKWCTDTKQIGPGWNGFWGQLDGFTAHGMSAKEACCGCGGGNKNPDDSEPLYSGVPSYPYAKVYELIVYTILHSTYNDTVIGVMEITPIQISDRLSIYGKRFKL